MFSQVAQRVERTIASNLLRYEVELSGGAWYSSDEGFRLQLWLKEARGPSLLVSRGKSGHFRLNCDICKVSLDRACSDS